MDASSVFIGTTGFSHPRWGTVGMPSPERLRAYAKDMRTVELAQTYYRDPLASTLRRWRERVPRDFRFSLHASRLITHLKTIADCEGELTRMWQTYKALGSTLSCVVFQIPPVLRADAKQIDTFLTSVALTRDQAGIGDVRTALEFRSASAYLPDMLAAMREYGTAFVTHDMPNRGDHVPALGPRGLTLHGSDPLTLDAWRDHGAATFFYLRLFGTVDGKPGSEYGAARLAPWAALLREAAETGSPVFAYVAELPSDARRLQDLLCAPGPRHDARAVIAMR